MQIGIDHFHFFTTNKKGMSVVEVLVAFGLMAILAIATMNLILSQQKEVAGLEDKLALQGIQSHLMSVLSDGTFCKCFMGADTFNYTTSSWNGFPASIAMSYDASCTAVGGSFLTIGNKMSPKIRPTSMTLQNITETVASSGFFSANLVLAFDQTLLTKNRKNISIPVNFKIDLTTGVASARPLHSCSSTSSTPTVDLPTLCNQINGFYNGTTCEPTYQ